MRRAVPVDATGSVGIAVGTIGWFDTPRVNDRTSVAAKGEPPSSSEESPSPHGTVTCAR